MPTNMKADHYPKTGGTIVHPEADFMALLDAWDITQSVDEPCKGGRYALMELVRK